MIAPRLAIWLGWRALPVWVWLLFLAWIALVQRHATPPDFGTTNSELVSAWTDIAARAEAWNLALLLLCAGFAVHAGGLIPRWRNRDWDWLGPRPCSPWRLVLSACVGLAAAALLWTLSAALCIETLLDRDQPGFTPVGVLDASQTRWIEDAPVLMPLAAHSEPTQLALAFRATRGAPFVRVEARLRSPTQQWSAAYSTVLSTRGTLRVPLAAMEPGWQLELRCSTEAAGALWVSGDSYVLAERPSSRAISVRMAWQVGLWLVLLISLGLALGAWMRAPIAWALLASGLLAAWTQEHRWLSLRCLREGWIPPLPSLATCAWLGLVVVGLLWIAALGLSRTRRAR